jgi:CHRD domain
MNNKQALNSTNASRNYSEIQKEGRTIPVSDILSRGHIMILVSMS